MANSTKKWEEKAKDFLPNHSIEDLQTMLKKEKKKLAKNRLKACILRKEGKTISQIVSKMRKPRTTIFDWLSKIQKFGLNRIYNQKQPGNKGKLSKENLKELDRILQDSPQKQNIPFKFWTNKLVQYFIQIKFKISYGIRFIQQITKKLGFSLQKPRPKNPKTSIKKQEEFIENVKKKFQISLKMDSRSFVLTKSIV
jgi:transposase